MFSLPCRRVLVVAGSVFFLAAALPAEGHAQRCFRNPTPECDGFGLVQFGVGAHLGTLHHRNPNTTPSRLIATLEVGYLSNVSTRDALGGALFFGANDIDGWVGLQGRYRRWLSGSASLDVGLGLAGTGRGLPVPMLMGEAGLNFSDRVSVFLQLQSMGNRQWFLDNGRGERQAGFANTYLAPSVTARLGQGLGGAVALAVVLLGVIGWAALAP